MKKFFLSLAMVLPMLAFVACGGSDDSNDPITGPEGEGGSGGGTEMNDGNGPIEEPILAFYDSPASIKSMEKRSIATEGLENGSGGIVYNGATSAKFVTYNFLEGQMLSCGTQFDTKNKDRVEDFLREKYRLVEDIDTSDDLTFESKDRLVLIGFNPTLAAVHVVYTRQFTQEQEKAKWAYPVLDWTKTQDEVKALEKRAFVKSHETALTFESPEYMGTVTYMFSPVPIASLGILNIDVTNIPTLHYDQLTKMLLDDGYVEIGKDPVGLYAHRYVNAAKNVQVDVLLSNRKVFTMSFHRPTDSGSQDEE